MWCLTLGINSQRCPTDLILNQADRSQDPNRQVSVSLWSGCFNYHLLLLLSSSSSSSSFSSSFSFSFSSSFSSYSSFTLFSSSFSFSPSYSFSLLLRIEGVKPKTIPMVFSSAAISSILDPFEFALPASALAFDILKSIECVFFLFLCFTVAWSRCEYTSIRPVANHRRGGINGWAGEVYLGLFCSTWGSPLHRLQSPVLHTAQTPQHGSGLCLKLKQSVLHVCLASCMEQRASLCSIMFIYIYTVNTSARVKKIKKEYISIHVI